MHAASNQSLYKLDALGVHFGNGVRARLYF
jgi:hypothetical protein